MEAGDSAAILAITLGKRPVMVPTASLRTVAPPKSNPPTPRTMVEAANAYWTLRGKGAPKAYVDDPSGVPIVVEVRT